MTLAFIEIVAPGLFKRARFLEADANLWKSGEKRSRFAKKEKRSKKERKKERKEDRPDGKVENAKSAFPTFPQGLLLPEKNQNNHQEEENGKRCAAFGRDQ